MNIKAKDLSKIGYLNDQIRSLVINTVSKHFKHYTKQQVLDLLIELRADAERFEQNAVLGKIAALFLDKKSEKPFVAYQMEAEPKPVKTFGSRFIDTSAKQQMKTALQLPIAERGALMPDAHSGYGLPIGGVLATNNAVIPYGVGVDIGCRMAMSIYPVSEKEFNQHKHSCKTALSDWTHFGMEGGLEGRREHSVLESPLFQEIPLLKPLKGKAGKQLGSSGGGNHFVEWGLVDITENNSIGLKSGKYVALLSHSGSRSLGATIAMHYVKKAMEVCKLPNYAKHFAWLDLDTELGQEYWKAMNLAGDYAKACHEVIHQNMQKQLGFEPIITIENHHNFAWKEVIDGKELIVHRKGATPAKEGELGIIPGSMIHPGYLVSGKGNVESLFSASHGAGRSMSRAKAKESNTVSAMKKLLAAHDVTLLGGSTEEAPNAYKNIEQVMASQIELVNVEGVFYPKIVRMNKE